VGAACCPRCLGCSLVWCRVMACKELWCILGHEQSGSAMRMHAAPTLSFVCVCVCVCVIVCL
jgi:hypothetical protein